jgi:UDP-N-acetyl-D-glucosamine dehydrogenase
VNGLSVSVVGLGKIGLPLAVQFAQRGLDVVGVDIRADTVSAVNRGEEPFPGEAELAQRLKEVLAAGHFRATTDIDAAVTSSSVVAIVVPLVVDAVTHEPDFVALDTVTHAVGGAVQPGTLVTYETTLPVHTTRKRFLPMLEARSGLACGRDLFVCHSPERVYSGRVFSDLRRYPKLVGGLDPASAKRAVEFYEAALEFDPRPELDRPNGVWDVGSAEGAELAKLAETTYRDINIAYANELAGAAEQLGIDVHDVIAASNSQPFSHIHRPGIAVGGHCIPVYPHFLLDSVSGFRLPAVARDVNRGMPGHAVEVIEQALGGLAERRVAVLGLSYRGGVKEHAFSGAFALVDLLRARRATTLVHDPLYDDDELRALGLQPFHLGDPADAVIVQADHAMYAELQTDRIPGLIVVYDGRGVLDPSKWTDVVLLRLGAPAR